MILRAAWKAMLERRGRLGLALAALTVAATLATALLGLYSDIERKLRGEFAGYGANLVLGPRGEDETVPLAALAEADKWGNAAPFLYRVETVRDEPVVVAAVDFARLAPLAGYWQVKGRREAGAGECLVGERVAERFRANTGSELGGRRVVGVVSTGGPEDAQIIVPLEGSSTWPQAENVGQAGPGGPARPGGAAPHLQASAVASLIAVRVEGPRVEEARRALSLPGIEVRVLRAVVESEAAVVLKIRGTLFLLTALVLGITVLCVMNNFGAVVYQRRKEIGVLKAIGGADAKVASLFAAEAAVLGVMGSVAGFGMGAAVVRWMGWQIFHQPASPPWETLPVVMGITLTVALAATIVPLGRIRRIEPAVILRGD